MYDTDDLSAWGRLNSQQVEILPYPPSSLVAAVNTDKSSSRMDPRVSQDWLDNVDAVCFNLRVDPGG
ncbi:hypothetical protein V6N12_061510 [Hibiscus sabdariffa]|uniref:Uncharacterized protein n=1 Tax=Hibiscus sabdariffa TaxID=183260 RepID=A0ABR2E0M1_9ROSI